MNEDTHRWQLSEKGSRSPAIILAHEQPFRIGDAEFRPATREVLYADQSFIIEPRVMQLLIALHRADGAVVNKDDLLRSCWDGRIVGEDAINRVVSRLRGVAKKEAGRQFRIETITKVGYRLLSASGGTLSAAENGSFQVGQAAPALFAIRPLRKIAMVVAGVVVLGLIAVAWLWPRAPVPAHSMMVHLSGFQALAADVPATMPETINAEIAAAFNADGVIGVTATPASVPGTASTYSLGGTIYRAGNSIRLITRFTNERSGVILWSDSVDYEAGQISKIPQKVAVHAGTVVRCGLSGAATYRKPLPDAVLSNYMSYCQEYWSYGGSKTLRFAERVVAAVPDFSWGWSAVGNGFMQASQSEPDGQRAEEMRLAGRRAEDRALTLDRSNSEALAHKAYLIDQRDWISQEALFKRAIAAKPLDCGCEHYGYGLKLQSVGRLGAAVDQFRAATNMLALWSDSQFALAIALVAADRADLASSYFRTAIELSNDPNFHWKVAVSQGIETGDYKSAIGALRSPDFEMSPEIRDALLLGYEALARGDEDTKAQAVQTLLTLSKDNESETVATMLGALGAHSEALQVASQRPWLFWRRSMRGVLSEPTFPNVLNELGLTTYWRTSGTKPDICLTKGPPPFCRLI